MLTDGTTQPLPRLGQASWENSKPAYNRTDTTLVIGDEDGVAGPTASCRYTRERSAAAATPSTGRGSRTEPITARRTGRVGVDRRPVPGRGQQGQSGRVRPLRGRLGPVGRASERRGAQGRPVAQPDRGRHLGSEAPERVLFPHHRGRRHDPGRAGSQPRRRRPVEGDVRGHRAARAGRHDRAPAGRLGGAVPQQAQQHGHRPARQPAAPGGPRQQRARRTDRRVRHEDGGPAAWSPSSTTICSRPAART